MAFLRFLMGFLALGTVGYLALVLVVYLSQSSYLYPSASEPVPPGAAEKAGFEAVAIETEDGIRIHGWWKPPQPGRALILYFHGNGGNLLNRAERARMLTEEGRGLLLVSYRGYSGAGGTPSEEGLRRDALAAYRFLSSYDPARIVVYGESLGSGVGVRLASERRVGGVILDAPFTSVPDVARRVFWYLPVDLLARDRYRSIDRIGAIGAPLLILHGEEDGLIPVALGERLFAAAKEPKRFVALPGVDHVGVLEEGGLPHARALLAEVERSFASAASGLDRR
ncbi:alpha/beta hydrolase [Enterovirga rhinocerotis]|uniref:Serine aminopeptidase S33 domain-containing protein n=1 Tax=Enterovirga rhinocerotis TaxID=1339210 RepID=A0A4R7C4R5_9HYPH|nr:alpha/beta hydrolase [Enterovirga rhinocerotis]TDR93378.1 hypothetical protein EV668_0639 [Enterovirga rhinocerotis]